MTVKTCRVVIAFGRWLVDEASLSELNNHQSRFSDICDHNTSDDVGLLCGQEIVLLAFELLCLFLLGFAIEMLNEASRAANVE